MSGKQGGKLVMALPKGRILMEVMPLLAAAGICPEADFSDVRSRRLRFATNVAGLEIIRVRSFDVATFVAFGAAQFGIAGNDVLMEFNYSELYAPLDLGIGLCRLVVAQPEPCVANDRCPQWPPRQRSPRQWSHVRVATKYPGITRRHFAARGVQAECIKLNGALELAPGLGLCERIVDLVSSGATLKANGLVEIEPIADVSARLVINRTAMKTMPDVMGNWLQRLAEIACARAS